MGSRRRTLWVHAVDQYSALKVEPGETKRTRAVAGAAVGGVHGTRPVPTYPPGTQLGRVKDFEGDRTSRKGRTHRR